MFSLFQKFLVSRLSGWMAIGLPLLLIGLFSYAHLKGYHACEKAAQKQQIEIMEVRNEIANNRPDDNATIKRLRSGSF